MKISAINRNRDELFAVFFSLELFDGAMNGTLSMFVNRLTNLVFLLYQYGARLLYQEMTRVINGPLIIPLL